VKEKEKNNGDKIERERKQGGMGRNEVRKK